MMQMVVLNGYAACMCTVCECVDKRQHYTGLVCVVNMPVQQRV